MGYKIQANFAGGELDPVLQKRVSLNKYSTGLATARNVVIGRTGRIMSRPGRKYIKDGGNLSGGSITAGADAPVIIHPMPWKSRYCEFGVGYVQVYEADGTVVGQDTNLFTAAEIVNLNFVNVKLKNNYNDSRGLDASYSEGYVTLVYDSRAAQASGILYDDGIYLSIVDLFWRTLPPTTYSLSANGTGYDVDYAFTVMVHNQESEVVTVLNGTTSAKLPLVSTATNKFTSILVPADRAPTSTDIEDTTPELRVYRRPTGGGVFGYIGSSKDFAMSGSDIIFKFEDFGQDADYTNRIPDYTPGLVEDGSSLILDFILGETRTGAMYQGRYVTAISDKIFASRPGFTGDFFRDFPLSADSALTTRIEGNGSSTVLHLIENDGLIAFTNDGVFLHRGLMSPTNLVFNRKSNHVIDHRVPPLNVPGGTIFVDAKTNTVRQLRYSDEVQGYIADELSIFSDHLFRENRVTSWVFDGGSLPLLWVTFADGTYATFTYEESQAMRAWTRHDSGTGIERAIQLNVGFDSTGANVESRMIFVTKETDGTQRWIEHGIKRFINVEEFETNPEVDKGEKIAAMDGIVSFSTLLNDDITDDDITVTPVVADTWDGDLTLSVVDDAIFPDPGAGAVGTVLYHFDPTDRTLVKMEVTARASDDSITVQPSATFPEDYATNPRLYVEQSATLTGLDHLDGVSVGVIVDGNVISSPNNDHQDYPVSTVASGSLTLPTGVLGAIIHVGRVYPMDIETLDLNSVEQKPTHNESLTCNKVKIETYLSRGLYVGGRFPLTDIVKGTQADKAAGRTMEPLDNYVVDYEDANPIIGNRYDQPATLEVEMTLPGSWKSNGRVCLRQVDPLHFEILALTPDVDTQRR